MSRCGYVKTLLPPEDRDPEIAGSLCCSDWYSRRNTLIDGEADGWSEAFDDFLMQRIQLRYLDPIDKVDGASDGRGEGFAIVALLCSLIEFLESALQGRTYRSGQNPDPIRYYNNAECADIFKSFLRERHPFNEYFDNGKAEIFYNDLRCGLLHDAQTRSGWLIWKGDDNDLLINFEKKILFRNNLRDAFDEFLADYRTQLCSSKELQEAFIRKFDAICEEARAGNTDEVDK
jgi:hypothetical protein